MKAMTKQELAIRAGVSRQTMSKWIKPFQEQLSAMGVSTKTKLLPPKAVKLLCDYYCIDVN